MESLPPIVGLSAGLISRGQFAAARWYQGAGRWYYHARAKANSMLTAATSCRYELVDPDLRSLCRWLHARGVGTLPSCQGHFYGRPYFQAAWKELCKDWEVIRQSGLPVRDSQSGSLSLFRDRRFELPWRNEADFCDAAMARQGGGYLGLLFPVSRQNEAARLANTSSTASAIACRDRRCEATSADGPIAGDGHNVSGDLFEFFVHAESPSRQSEAWAVAASLIRAAFGEDQP